MQYLIEKAFVKNFKGLQRCEVNFLDDNGSPVKTFYIVGKNGSGKSSLLEGILFAIKGRAAFNMKKKDQYKLINGKANKATAAVTIQNVNTNEAYEIIRKISKTTESVSITKNGSDSVDESFLEKLLSEYTFDIRAFLALDKKKQAELLGINTSEHDRKIQIAKATLSEVNKDKLKLIKLVETPIAVVEPIKIADLFTEQTVIEAFNHAQEEKEKARGKSKNNIDELTEEIEKIKSDIVILQKKVKDWENILSEKKQALASLPKGMPRKSLLPIQEKIKTADETNRKAAEYQNYIKKTSELEKIKTVWALNKQTVKELKKEKEAFIAENAFPGIGIDDEGGLLVNGKQLNEREYNTAKAIKLALKILSHNKTELPLFFIKSGGDFDKEPATGQTILFEELSKKGFQFIVELVQPRKPAGINSILMVENKLE